MVLFKSRSISALAKFETPIALVLPVFSRDSMAAYVLLCVSMNIDRAVPGSTYVDEIDIFQDIFPMLLREEIITTLPCHGPMHQI